MPGRHSTTDRFASGRSYKKNARLLRSSALGRTRPTVQSTTIDCQVEYIYILYIVYTKATVILLRIRDSPLVNLRRAFEGSFRAVFRIRLRREKKKGQWDRAIPTMGKGADKGNKGRIRGNGPIDNGKRGQTRGKGTIDKGKRGQTRGKGTHEGKTDR